MYLIGRRLNSLNVKYQFGFAYPIPKPTAASQHWFKVDELGSQQFCAVCSLKIPFYLMMLVLNDDPFLETLRFCTIFLITKECSFLCSIRHYCTEFQAEKLKRNWAEENTRRCDLKGEEGMEEGAYLWCAARQESLTFLLLIFNIQ